MRWNNHLNRKVFLLALLILLPLPGYTANPTIETILLELQRGEAARQAAIRDMVYTAKTQVLEWQDPSRTTVKSETLSLRRVYLRESDQIHNEYLSMSIDGRSINKKEMERELAKQRRGGRSGGEGEFQSPFSPEAAPLYNFELIGADLFEGQTVWLVSFKPERPANNRFAGTAFLSQEDYQLLYVEAVLSKLPGVLKEFDMSIRFAPVDGYWLPSVFSIDMRVRVNFLITLTDRTLSVVDRYSEYRLNVGLDDSLFADD